VSPAEIAASLEYPEQATLRIACEETRPRYSFHERLITEGLLAVSYFGVSATDLGRAVAAEMEKP